MVKTGVFTPFEEAHQASHFRVALPFTLDPAINFTKDHNSFGDSRAPFHLSAAAMSDPTALVLTASFVAAMGIFILGAVLRVLRSGGRQAENERNPADVLLGSPDQPPIYQAQPPPLPMAGIPTGIYNRVDLLGIALIYFIFSGLIMSAVNAPKQAELMPHPSALVTSIGLQFMIAGIAVVMVQRRIHPIAWLGLRWPQWPWVFLIAPFTVIAMWLVFWLLQFGGYMRWIESLGVETMQDSVKLLQTSNDHLVLGLMAFAAVIVAPMCEEVVFRGYLYPASKKFAGPWVAATFTSLVFASAHGSLAALLPLFIFGLVLAYAYEKTGSLWAPIAIHLCFNGATVAMQLAARALNVPLDPSL